MPDKTTFYAYCFSHGTMHTFDTGSPWCTATWAALASTSREDAETDKLARFGTAASWTSCPWSSRSR